jgi:hypothetical protein
MLIAFFFIAVFALIVYMFSAAENVSSEAIAKVKHILRTQSAYDLNDYKKAIDGCGQAIKNSKRFAAAYYKRGIAYDKRSSAL